MFGGLAVSLWWAVGAMLYPPASQALPVPENVCDDVTLSNSTRNATDWTTAGTPYDTVTNNATLSEPDTVFK